MNPAESKIEAQVEEQYNAQAQSYDQRWSRYLRKTLTFSQTTANIASTAKVLDVGCGTGELERLLLANNPEQMIVSLDISAEMLAQAQQKLKSYPHVSFEQGSASDLPFPDRVFDVVVSASSFHYFPEPEKALAEMHRVLKPNGQVVILDWCKDFLLCRICDWVLKRVDPAHQQCYTEAEFHQLLQVANFQIQDAQTMHFDLVWGLMIATADRS